MTVPSGALRFNSDSGKLEYYNGEVWWQIDNFSADNATGGARGVFAGASNPSLFGGGYNSVNTIDYINIQSTGSAIDFGDLLSTGGFNPTGASSRTRGLYAGGFINPANVNTIQFLTISSTGDAQDFGDLPYLRQDMAGVSNGTRALFAGGSGPASNAISYVTIASTGDSVNYGELTNARSALTGMSSSTRGVFAGGGDPNKIIIDYVTISTTGNAIYFGDLNTSTKGSAEGSNSTRGIVAGSFQDPGTLGNQIQYITLATTGNSIDFGDLTQSVCFSGGCSSPTRMVRGGGSTSTSPSTQTDVIDYVQIMTTGNAIDFGDLQTAKSALSGLSNGHGGL